jgi:phenol 2-monooxygenase (NADPH)
MRRDAKLLQSDPRRPIDQSAIKRFTPSGAEFDSVIDLRATSQQGRRDLSVDTMP